MAVEIRAMEAGDVDAARHICNVAFGTFVGHPEPKRFFGDADFVGTRFGAPHTRAFVAVEDGIVIGSNIATCWGKLGLFGPLSIDPNAWDKGLGKRLMDPVMDAFGRWGCSHRALFTFPHSAKHIGLYRKYGFYPRYLTAVTTKAIHESGDAQYHRWSALSESDRAAARASVEALTDGLLAGLSVAQEIDHVAQRGLGDTILVGAPDQVDGIMVCHTGPGTEAGGGQCYGKFGAVRSSRDAAAHFGFLLHAVEAFAASQGLASVTLGVNLARRPTYEALCGAGYRTVFQGVAMQSGESLGTCTEDHFVTDDWR